LAANVKGDGRIFRIVWEGRSRCCIRTEHCLAFYASALLQALAAMTQNSDRPALSFSDSCKVLGVNEHVTEEDLKTAFHKKALLYHPDRFFNSPQSEQEAAERKFCDAKAAYERVASRFKSPEPSSAHFYYQGYAQSTVNPVLKRRTNILIAAGITLGCLLFGGAYTVFHMRPMYDHKRFISEGPEKAEQRKKMLQERVQLAKARAESSDSANAP
jgi:hypothetical protein